MPLVTVGIPVGPSPHACRWLDDALVSVRAQTVRPDILLIDDMHGLPWEEIGVSSNYGVYKIDQNIHVWRSPWRLGVAHAFNMCVALSSTPLTIMMGADDTLEPDCVEQTIQAYMTTPREVRENTYFTLPLRYMDTGEVQYQACNAAAVTRGLWERTGGLPIESASGAPDAAFLSMMWDVPWFRIRLVSDHVLYNYRRHDGTDTVQRSMWHNVIYNTRDILTANFQEPQWGRKAPK